MVRSMITAVLVTGVAFDVRAEPPPPVAANAPAPGPSATPAAAPVPAPAPPVRGRDRMLGGHRFIPFQTVTWPFVVFRFGSDTAIGGSRLVLEEQARAPVGDRVASFRSFEQTLRAGLRLLPWLGAEAQVRGALALGADDAGALALGANYEYGGALGALVNFVKTRNVYISARMDVRLARVEGILPEALIDSAVVVGDEVVYDPGAINYHALDLRFAPSLSGAFALSRFFGLQTSAGFDVVRLGSNGAHDWEERVSAAAGLSLFVSPVSILFGVRIDHDLDPDVADAVFRAIEPIDGTRGEIEAAVYSSGRPELDLGLGVRTLVASDDHRTLGTVTLGYYW